MNSFETWLLEVKCVYDVMKKFNVSEQEVLQVLKRPTLSLKTVKSLRMISENAFDDKLDLLLKVYKLRSDNDNKILLGRAFSTSEFHKLRKALTKAPEALEYFENLYNLKETTILPSPDKRKLVKAVKSVERKYNEGGKKFVFDLWEDDINIRGLWSQRNQLTEDYRYYFNMYLESKYSDIVCFPQSKTHFKFVIGQKGVINDSDVLDRIHNLLRDCDKTKRFVCILISFKDKVKGLNHANALIIDRILGTAELFEPHGDMNRGGYSQRDLEDVYYILEDYFNDQEYEFYYPEEVCPRIGPQKLETQDLKMKNEIGYCEAWSLWYIEMRLKYADIPRHILLPSILDIFTNDGKIALGVIRNYAEVLTSNMKLMHNWEWGR